MRHRKYLEAVAVEDEDLVGTVTVGEALTACELYEIDVLQKAKEMTTEELDNRIQKLINNLKFIK